MTPSLSCKSTSDPEPVSCGPESRTRSRHAALGRGRAAAALLVRIRPPLSRRGARGLAPLGGPLLAGTRLVRAMGASPAERASGTHGRRSRGAPVTKTATAQTRGGPSGFPPGSRCDSAGSRICSTPTRSRTPRRRCRRSASFAPYCRWRARDIAPNWSSSGGGCSRSVRCSSESTWRLSSKAGGILDRRFTVRRAIPPKH